MSNKNLVLLTADFPFGSGETFLETEIIYLCKGFEKVIIIASNTTSPQTRNVPDNCHLLRMDISQTKSLKLKSILSILNPLYLEEKRIIRKIYNKEVTKGIVKTMLISLERAKRVAHFIYQQNFNFDNTIFYSYWCDDVALGLALLTNKNDKIKAVARIHRWDIYFEESTVNYLPFRWFIVKNLKNIISISQDGIDYAQKEWKVDNSSFRLSRLGIIKVEGYEAPPKNEIFKIVSCSNVIKVKRVELISEALQLLPNYKIEWTHLGGGVLMDNLKKKVKSLPSNIKVNLKGRVPNPEIYQSYRDIQPHLFINVSSSEGVPVSIMEAMSFGIPCMATDVGGNSEIVTHKNGCLLPPQSTAKEIAQEIERFIQMEDSDYQKYAKETYRTWKEEYNADKNYTEFVELLIDVAK